MHSRVGNKMATGKTKYNLACSTYYSLRIFTRNIALRLLIVISVCRLGEETLMS